MKIALRLLALLAVCGAAFAQKDRATLTGTVRDPSGSVVPEAKVTVTFPATGLIRSVTTTGAGVYLVPQLPVGSASIDVEKAGFRTIHLEIPLSVGQTRTLDHTFEVSTTTSAVEVVSEADLVRNSAEYGNTFQNSQISRLPINGRNWGTLMTLVPGAVDTGAGSGSSVRFFGHLGDDNNFRIDGVDATSVRNQSNSKSRLAITLEAISEFRVTSALYTAETGGSNGGQIEIVTKSGANRLHGSAFEYLRNNIFDARSPFDGRNLPPFRLNQYGGTLGGAFVRNKMFFFATYEGLIQRQGITQTGFVPDAAFRARAVPAIAPLLAFYPEGQTATSTPNVRLYTGVGNSTQDEHVGIFRLDRTFSGSLTGYLRFSKNRTVIFAPNSALPYGTRNKDAPTSGVIALQWTVSPRTTNEFRLGANYAQPLNSIPTGAPASFSIPSLSTIPGGNRRLAVGITESLVDQWSSLRGAHTLKAGLEIRRVQLIVHDYNLSDATASYASLAAFQNNQLNTLAGSGELPTKQNRKIQYFGYGQDEWKIRPNFTANLGLRYEFYNVFTERFNRDIPFDIQDCGGYCPVGSEYAHPDLNNFAPRVSFAWSPEALGNRTVIRFGGGYYYGDAQLGDQYAPANNDAVRYALTAASTPGLSFPFDPFISNTGLAAAPRSIPRNKRNQVSQQYGFSIQHAINSKVTAQLGYSGQAGYHVFSRTYVNVINPITGQRPLPSLNQIDVRGEDSVSRFNGFIATLQTNQWRGIVYQANYTWSHSIDDGNVPQNVACRSCEKASSDFDVRHVFTTNFAYSLPWGATKWYGGWEWSGIGTARTGLPLNITVTRRATDLLDGNVLSPERPNRVYGVPLYPQNKSAAQWLNPAAFSVPAINTYGNLGRNAVRAPGLFQIDTALSKKTRLGEHLSLDLGAQVFNLLNHPQLGTPALNFSSTSNFGRITSPINTSPVGTGTPRQVQVFGRLSF